MQDEGRGLFAEWIFPDGVAIRTRERVKTRHTRWSEVEGRVRVYVTANERFNVLEDLENRARRPHHVWRPRVVDALARIGIEYDFLSWSQKAGCTMCPCSPGFIAMGESNNVVDRGWDFWVTIPDAPSVDESKPGRQLVGSLL